MKATAPVKTCRHAPSAGPIASDAGLVWLQLLAVCAMLLDHVNWFWFAHGGDPRHTTTVWMNDVGRLAFPLFAFCFGVNLHRVLNSPARDERIHRLFRRLALAGLAAQGAYWPLRGYANPVNVMATFGLTAGVVRYWSLSKGPWQGVGRCFALASAIVLGAFVEYWWFGIALIGAAYQWARSSNLAGQAVFAAALAALCLLNQNLWALASLAIIALLGSVHWAPPRMRGVFYVIYPAHLWLILAVRGIAP